MGEIGRSLIPVVRDIDDRNLVQAWSAVGHGSRVGVESTCELAARMEQTSVNISRAGLPQDRSFPVVQSFPLTATTSIQTANTYAFMASSMFSNAGVNCYSLTLVQTSPKSTLPNDLACGSVSFSTGSLTLTLPLPSGAKGNVFLNTRMVVSDSPFLFSGVIAQWSQSGS
jgi:hypothetical protein